MEPKNGSSVILKMIITAIATAVVTFGVGGLITLGAEKQRVESLQVEFQSHLKTAEVKINELNELKIANADISRHLISIDQTLKDINEELKKKR